MAKASPASAHDYVLASRLRHKNLDDGLWPLKWDPAFPVNDLGWS